MTDPITSVRDVYKRQPFEMATYTDKDHSIYGGNNRQHLYSRIIEFLDRKLK